jgi:cytoskeleton protein RodZ
LVAEVPILEAAPTVEIDIAAISVDETSEGTQPVTGTLADGAQSGAATPTGVLPTAALPTATLPGATMATSAGGTDLGAVEGALTTRPADDVVADQMATVTPDSTDAMDNTMSSQIGTGVAFARQRVPELEITLRAAGASWVEIIRNDGEEVMAKLMRDGDTYMVDSRDRLYLSTGNAGGLELVFNDGTVRSVGDPGEILRDLLLDATKLRNQF